MMLKKGAFLFIVTFCLVLTTKGQMLSPDQEKVVRFTLLCQELKSSLIETTFCVEHWIEYDGPSNEKKRLVELVSKKIPELVDVLDSLSVHVASSEQLEKMKVLFSDIEFMKEVCGITMSLLTQEDLYYYPPENVDLRFKIRDDIDKSEGVYRGHLLSAVKILDALNLQMQSKLFGEE